MTHFQTTELYVARKWCHIELKLRQLINWFTDSYVDTFELWRVDQTEQTVTMCYVNTLKLWSADKAEQTIAICQLSFKKIIIFHCFLSFFDQKTASYTDVLSEYKAW